MNRDTTIGIVGCVILIAAMVGVFWYERSAAESLLEAPESPTNATAAGPTLTGTVALGDTTSALANITNSSARNVTFHLTWTATNGRDTLKLTVAPPTGSGIPEGGISEPTDTGDITVTVLVPAGADPQGEWKVEVEFTSAAPDALPGPGGIPPPTPPPNSTDSSVAFTVEIALA